MFDSLFAAVPLLLASIGVPLPPPAPAPAVATATPTAASTPQDKPPEEQDPANPTDETPAGEQPPQETPPADQPPPKFHKSVFKNLRFEEDWSALKDPEMETDHWMPGLKLIELDGDGDWTASFGGQMRFQTKSEQNRNLLGGPVPHNNDFNLLRLRLHGDLRYRDDLRFFVEMLDGSIHANDAPPLAIDENNHDFLNAFIEYPGKEFLARLGRFEMQYGAQRLISPLEWANTRRTFQGGLVRSVNDQFTTDVFVTKSVDIDADDWDTTNADRYFSGVYNTW